MKLRMLAAAAGFILLPAIAGAQVTDTTRTDTTRTDTTVTVPAPMPEPVAAPVTTSTSSTTMPGIKDSIPGPRPTPPSDGKSCPWGCPTSGGAAGLSGVQFLALQQELRDGQCGNNHVTGRLDAATRRAIRLCAEKLGVANNARAVLIAMDIGFSEADIPMSNED